MKTKYPLALFRGSVPQLVAAVATEYSGARKKLSGFLQLDKPQGWEAGAPR